MTWVRGILGVLGVLLGLGWVGQGIGLLPGSFMSGQIQWAIIGAVLVVIGGWLLWDLYRRRRPV
jgi:hypothetical protein